MFHTKNDDNQVKNEQIINIMIYNVYIRKNIKLKEDANKLKCIIFNYMKFISRTFTYLQKYILGGFNQDEK